MKPIDCLLKTLVLASSLGIAVSGLAQDTTTVPPSTSAVANKTVAGKNALPASGAKKPAIIEKEPVIPGIVIPRTNGGYLGLTLENSNFKLSFYDAKKKPVTVDVARATARWPVHYKTTEERTVLNPTPDNLALIANKFVRPPYVFKLYLTLLKGEEGTAEDSAAASAESYTIDFQQ
jgi:hypothetical protein